MARFALTSLGAFSPVALSGLLFRGRLCCSTLQFLFPNFRILSFLVTLDAIPMGWVIGKMRGTLYNMPLNVAGMLRCAFTLPAMVYQLSVYFRKNMERERASDVSYEDNRSIDHAPPSEVGDWGL